MDLLVNAFIIKLEFTMGIEQELTVIVLGHRRLEQDICAYLLLHRYCRQLAPHL